jgi:hypothetical protein
MHIRDQGGQGVFRLSFEILFNIPQELVDLLSDLDKRIRDRWGGTSLLTSSSLVWGGSSEMIRIAFSEPLERGVLPQPGSLLRALGSIECSRPSICVELYSEVHESTRMRGLRVRLFPT